MATIEWVTRKVDIFFTNAGNFHIIRSTYMKKMKSNANVGNIDPFKNEIFRFRDHAAAGNAEACIAAAVAWKSETLPEYWWCIEQMLTVQGADDWDAR